MLRTLLPKMSSSDLFNVEAGSAFVDRTANQFAVDSSFQHAMTDPGQSVDEARKKACQFILTNISLYEKFKDSNVGRYRTMAHRALGMALHPIMDSTSPSHEGWQTWEPTAHPLDSISGHGNRSPEDLKHLTSARLNMALAKMRRVMRGEDCTCVMR